MNEYTCTVCGRSFVREKKLRADAVVRCDPCRDEAKKASRRDTWHRHKGTYRPGGKPIQKPAQKPIQPEIATVSSEPVGKPVDWWLPNGHRVVWMSRLP